ncbi:MAG TPA: MarR family transcriptional regulator [Rhodothermales bacterium]|nr:MarR family transcriptional regulator [Rhodothermales bacterium]
MTDPCPDAPRERPFASLAQEAQLAVIRTAALLMDDFELLLKPHGITGPQYNVLRILRGAEPDALCRNEIRDRMLTRMPDMTRLLDRMEEARLVARTRDAADRRLVSTALTAEGRRVLDALDAAVCAEQRRRFQALDEGQVRTLVDLLSTVRQTG